MSGPLAAYDDNSTKMAQVFIDDINAKGGLLGRKIKAVFADTKSDRAEGAKAGQEVLRQGADVVFGTCDYDYGAPALLQAQKAGKISIFLCAEDPKAGIAGIGPYSFTSSVAAQVQGAVGAEWGLRQEGLEDRLRFARRFDQIRQISLRRVRLDIPDQGWKDRRSRYVQERRFVDRLADHPPAQLPQARRST
jgi:hypothetical protein